MWSGAVDEIASATGLNMRDAAAVQCTAEHLVARKDGGRQGANIVAAHARCNHSRHVGGANLTPPKQAARLKKQLLNGGLWSTAVLRAMNLL